MVFQNLSHSSQNLDPVLLPASVKVLPYSALIDTRSRGRSKGNVLYFSPSLNFLFKLCSTAHCRADCLRYVC